MLHYYEYLLVVVMLRVADEKSSEQYGGRICSGTKYSVSWVGRQKLLDLRDKVQR